MPYQFSFKEDDDDVPIFQCHLKHYRCEHINPKTGKRCNRQQYIGFDRCWKHLETDFHLKIKPSSIPHAGRGLFAFNGMDNNDIVFRGSREKGDRIIAYNAELISGVEIEERYGEFTAPYAVEINKELVEDGACWRSAGSIANHKSHSRANAKLYIFQNRAYLRATKNIRNGQEITIDYGKDYNLSEKGIHSETKYVRGKSL